MLCSFAYPHQSYIFSNSAITSSEMKGKKERVTQQNCCLQWENKKKKRNHVILHLFLMVSSMLPAFLTTVENWSSVTPKSSSVRTVNSEYNICKLGIVFLQIHLDMTKLSFAYHYPVTRYWFFPWIARYHQSVIPECMIISKRNSSNC